ncbi:hypothetical protein [Kouleothrix sp.]|uniref:hypothetical protein n=1 Tax=Kouleothrix sp. TaxID=2779161 RepID=UPI00391AF103
MELIIVIIGIGLSLILNIVAIARIERRIEKQRQRLSDNISESIASSVETLSDQIYSGNIKSLKGLLKVNRQLGKNRVDIMNEVFAVQAMVRDGKKRREMK